MPRYGELKYGPILDHLAAQPPDVRAVTLTLDAIAALVGPLPAGAWNASFWNSGEPARRTWQPLGWRAQLDRGARAVHFTRRGSGDPRPAAATAPWLPALPSRRQGVDRAALAAAYQAGTPGTVLAQQYGLTRQGVYYALQQAGVARRPRRHR